MPITYLDKDESQVDPHPRKLVRDFEMNEIKSTVNAIEDEINGHVALINNPHSVTKSQVGLTNVDNTADVDKPVSNAVTAALEGKASLGAPVFITSVTTPLIKITGGSPGAGKVLTSDADGDATWETPSAAGASIANTPAGNIAATTVQGAINELDTEKQPIDADLTAIAALTPTNDDFLQRKSGAWANRTVSQVKIDLDVDQIDNTPDLGKPISTDTQAALNLKTAAGNFITRATPSGTVDGVNDEFTAPHTFVNGSDQVFLNGMLQDEGDDYSRVGSVFTFTLAPEAGSKIRMNYIIP